MNANFYEHIYFFFLNAGKIDRRKSNRIVLGQQFVSRRYSVKATGLNEDYIISYARFVIMTHTSIGIVNLS